MKVRRFLGAAALAIVAGAAQAASYPEPLANEPIPNVVELSAQYPASWIYVQDLHFNSLPDGRAAIVDVAADARAFKGQVPVAQFGTLLPSTTRPDIYVAETFFSRMTRGERTDVITIWDKATLKTKGEIVLPGGKRGQFVTLRNSFQLTNGEKWALLFNFTPASSVSVIDIDARKILNEIDLPGCSLVYPTGPRGFTSLCADGTMTSIELDDAGKVAASSTSKPINDIDHDPMFMTPAMVGKTAWFVTFKGNIHGLDLANAKARDLGVFPMPKEKTAEGEWRPGGWQVISADAAGRLYVLMNPAGKEGSHKDGGSEVWVVDPARKQRVARIPLQNPAVSVEVTAQSAPLLVASRSDGSLDVYDAASGAFQRTLAQVVHDPMTMTASR
ncbi:MULTISPECIES: amine dehydrogenase large subunit [Sphingomonadales]|uniref:Methylamine dehydrogenase heavy subunit n=1 Tax=Rhizorhabdus wittichii (strain DSM 6014 / CCUG 31198 / JCM 15750 / NBRC 105917 / EY 4224 / RW1) TaxID=392499 RepID=A0A9J9HFB9_RHIWR|nr:methylamine dehydrogenase heavy subunit [Rhizorhabdus wittichii RW1]